ncbi:uncharacterized protein CLUP02_00264 [Colletotrichum lupini]|uniref:Uncharacterized protein n=1 Tax=Colletotrichum lupini TaxID=145971 RepID=A0A9Q8SAD7_9PEZI|nr:uncharacterized protein CLUP02_00264 [Colletotrichum lupini]UQC73619.1 hypothetical protein CLUP02_00264 [Colletotrichum lupini]
MGWDDILAPRSRQQICTMSFQAGLVKLGGAKQPRDLRDRRQGPRVVAVEGDESGEVEREKLETKKSGDVGSWSRSFLLRIETNMQVVPSAQLSPSKLCPSLSEVVPKYRKSREVSPSVGGPREAVRGEGESQQLALDYATATTRCYFAQNSVTAPNSWQKDSSLPVAVHPRGSWSCTSCTNVPVSRNSDLSLIILTYSHPATCFWSPLSFFPPRLQARLQMTFDSLDSACRLRMPPSLALLPPDSLNINTSCAIITTLLAERVLFVSPSQSQRSSPFNMCALKGAGPPGSLQELTDDDNQRNKGPLLQPGSLPPDFAERRA